MGPLFTNEYISSEVNLLLALVIGIAFGFILEQAGFSSSRKLAGVFYGYDFTVLRVFFTAGITTMSGLIIFEYLGFIDLNLIYVNPYFIGPAITGGVIMGAGFVIGGFCPGTGIVAAAIGKIDALYYFIGLFLGIFVFAEAFPFLEGFYQSGFQGNVLIFESLGLSRGAFAGIMILVALSAFIATSFIQNNVNGKRNPVLSIGWVKKNRRLSFAIFSTLFVALIMFVIPGRKERLMAGIDKKVAKLEDKQLIHPEDLAFRIVYGLNGFYIIDTRSEEEFKRESIPGAINIPFENLIERDWISVLGNPHQTKIFVSSNKQEAFRAIALSQRMGYENLAYLEGGFNRFKQLFMIQGRNMSDENEIENDFYKRASKELIEMQKKSVAPKITKKKTIKVKGGC